MVSADSGAVVMAFPRCFLKKRSLVAATAVATFWWRSSRSWCGGWRIGDARADAAVGKFDAERVAGASPGGRQHRRAVLVAHQRKAAIEDGMEGVALQQLAELVDSLTAPRQRVDGMTLQRRGKGRDPVGGTVDLLARVTDIALH